MGKEEFIENIFANMPQDIACGSIFINNCNMPLRRFISDYIFDEITNRELTPKDMALIIERKFRGKIIPATKQTEQNKRDYIKRFINNCHDYVAEIMISPTETLNVTDFLLSQVSHMDDAFYIVVGPQRKTVEEVYRRILENRYVAPTFEDKQELCAFELQAVDEEVQNSMITYMGQNYLFKQFILDIVPAMMDTATTIILNGEQHALDEYLLDLIQVQEQKLTAQKLEKFNRTGEIPDLVPEIEVYLAQNKKQEITLTPEEEASLMAPQDDKELYYKGQLNNLIDAVTNVNDSHNLSAIDRLVIDIKTDINRAGLTDTLSGSLKALDQAMTSKRKNLIKIDSNRDEYIEAFKNQLAMCYDLATNLNTQEECDNLRILITKLETEYEEKGFDDDELLQAMNIIKKRLGTKQILMGHTAPLKQGVAFDNGPIKG